MSARTAKVEVLQAAVRVLMVGSRQITISVFNQLDWVPFGSIEPFGRVRVSKPPRQTDPFADNRRHVEIVGMERDSGALVRSSLREPYPGDLRFKDQSPEVFEGALDTWSAASELPLIVLAGLR